MKAEVFDGAFQLSGRFARRMQRQMREAAITVWWRAQDSASASL
jgi:hypothetical protein